MAEATKGEQATLSIYMAARFKREVKIEAAFQGMSSSEWVRHVLRAAVKASKKRRQDQRDGAKHDSD
ncbi:MAG: hypothetical protein ABIJ75_10595 [Actinomycetota bacterium]